MLLHKAWLESRVRFLIGVGVVACLCFVFVLFHEALRTRMVIAGGGRPTPSTSIGGSTAGS